MNKTFITLFPITLMDFYVTICKGPFCFQFDGCALCTKQSIFMFLAKAKSWLNTSRNCCCWNVVAHIMNTLPPLWHRQRMGTNCCRLSHLSSSANGKYMLLFYPKGKCCMLFWERMVPKSATKHKHKYNCKSYDSL